MQPTRRSSLFLLIFLAMTSLAALAQTLIDTVPVGPAPRALAINTLTNKIYVSNWAGASVTVIDGATDSTTTVSVPEIDAHAIAVNRVTNKIFVADDAGSEITVIDGATLSTTVVTVGGQALAVAVNEVTNKIYVACGLGVVTVIDGASLATTTIQIPGRLGAVAVNSVTNKIYTLNQSGNTVTVIDGLTLSTTNIIVGNYPYALAVNPITNKVYVAMDPFSGGNTVTVIDGVSLNTTSVTVGQYPVDVAVNAITNKIYVACEIGTVTVIDGSTNQTISVPAGNEPFAVAVDPVTNKSYAVNSQSNTVTIIDGQDLSTITIPVGNDPDAVAVNPVTNRIYVPNYADDTVSVIGGSPPTPLQFVPLSQPCRAVDTRPQNGGGGPIQGGTFQNFAISSAGSCPGLPSAAAYSMNVSVVPNGPLGYLTVWPAGQPQPLASTLNSLDGRIKANAAIIPAGANGDISVYATNTTNVIVDINGYFAPVSGSTLAFYPLSPCRVADTRYSTYPQGLGPPFLNAGQERQFPILNATSCNIPSSAAAYSLNFSVVPHGSLFYMTVWPTGENRPVVSTLNDIPGQIIANAAIVVAGTGGDVSVYPTNDTDLVIDINGYFAAAGTGGLSLYGVQPCRVIDTRHVGSGQPFSGTLNPPVNVVDSSCGVSSLAQAYVFNASVVPVGALGYLTLWPDGANQPVVSTLNALDGSISSNMAIVPSTNGKIDAYASGLTQLILDISGYFAP
jgi:YVTN family beta-propeller protein